MTEDRPSNDHLPDAELEQLRQDWVDAYRAWTQVAGNGPANSNPTDDQRATLGRYHAAQTAYFSHPRMQDVDA